ncbi:MAG: Arylsulfatase [Lentisphaerae bacterium ADurb.BinA184]|nr:MAG: Arylsulfatase [Lentisphaerae bacterium ADurb.BinA184]
MDRPHILLIMTDQHRADHVGWHPHSRLALPNIDRIAEGHAFLNCITANPICTPARTGLLTGRYTHQIGTLAMSGDLPRGIPTYAQALRRAGYHTAGIGKFHWLQTAKWGAPMGHGVDLAGLHDELQGYGFDEVWEATGKQLALANRCDWCRRLEAKGLLDAYRRHVRAEGGNSMTAEKTVFRGDPWPFAEEDYADIVTADRMLESLRRRPADKPFFGFLSFCSPHAPFDPPERFLRQVPPEQDDAFVLGGPDDEPMSEAARERMRKLRRAYKAMLLCVDEQVGWIFAALEAEGMWDNTVILFTSDHGEMLGDHGHFQKMRFQSQSTVVPTAIRHPAHLNGGRCDRVIELTDLTATILDAAGLEPAAALSKDWPAFNDRIPARSLLPILRGETDAVRPYAFCECNGAWYMIQDETRKYVYRPGADEGTADREHLFAWRDDPAEAHDLAPDEASRPVLERMRARLLHILATTPAAQTRWAPLMGADGSDDFPLAGKVT